MISRIPENRGHIEPLEAMFNIPHKRQLTREPADKKYSKHRCSSISISFPPPTWWVLTFVIFATMVVPTVAATPIVPKFPVGNKTRTDFCPLLTKLKAGKITIGTALTGLTIYVGVEPNTPLFEMNVNQTTGLPSGGFSYALQQALATVGGFKVKYAGKICEKYTKQTCALVTEFIPLLL